MALNRCCSGETYVLPDTPTRVNGGPLMPAWVICCFDCDRVLACVVGPRDEVYFDL